MENTTEKPWKSFGLKYRKGLNARYNRVIKIENNGEHLCVQFVRDNGEIASGCYKRIGWAWVPSEERASSSRCSHRHTSPFSAARSVEGSSLSNN